MSRFYTGFFISQKLEIPVIPEEGNSLTFTPALAFFAFPISPAAPFPFAFFRRKKQSKNRFRQKNRKHQTSVC